MTLVPLLLAALVAPVPADTSLVALQARVAAIAASVDGDVGAAAIHLESGVGVATDGDEPFFLASVYKLPIAIALLRRVDAGSVSLGDTVRLGRVRSGRRPREGDPGVRESRRDGPARVAGGFLREQGGRPAEIVLLTEPALRA